jgi:DNA-binding NarL/FixJ family response regulator
MQSAIALKPDVIVMDISMPGMNGLAATRALKQKQPKSAIITLTGTATTPTSRTAARRRLGYVLKQSAPGGAAAGDSGGGGRRAVPRLDAHGTSDREAARTGGQGQQVGVALSEREAEVLRLIASGYSNKEIAGRLSLSVKTVEAHKANAMRKLGLRGRIDIVKYAVLQGWLENA